MNKRERQMEMIWRTYHPKLQVYLKQFFPLTKNIEDRVSDILLKIFDKLETYNPEFALSTWIYRIARNSQIDEIRKVVPTIIEYSDDVLTNEDSPEDLFFKKYDIDLLRDVINKLDPAQKELIFLYYYEEQNYREISEITGIPEGTLKFRMSCARNKIKSMIERSNSYENQY